MAPRLLSSCTDEDNCQLGLRVMQIRTTTTMVTPHTPYQNSTRALPNANGFSETPSERQTTILIIDDNAPIREALTLVLEYEHFNVLTATDGCEGLTTALREKPDLIVVDFSLPRLSGAQVLAQLRRQAEFTDVPVVGITGYDEWAAADILHAAADRALIN